MEKQDIKSILDKVSSGRYNAREEHIAKYWIHQLNNGKPAGYSDEGLERVSGEMWRKIMQSRLDVVIEKKRLWPKYLAAAAAVVAVVFGLLIYRHYLGLGRENLLLNDVGPGTSGATLTLADGRRISLGRMANAELAKIAGLRITQTADGTLLYDVDTANSKPERGMGMNILSTARGESYRVRLPDGSMVWLNAASSLTYPTNLNKTAVRKVKLDGEAYFEIAKLNGHTPAKRNLHLQPANRVPFIVETAKQAVAVLGTHFNINAYSNENHATTTLLEGSVRVSAGPGIGLKPAQEATLKPDQQAISTGGTLKVKSVIASEAVAWKNGLFVFEDESLESIMRKVSRWYNVEVIFAPGVDKDELYYGSVSRYDRVSKVLETLEETKGIHFKIEGRSVTLMK